MAQRFHVLLVEDDPDDVFFLQGAFDAAAPGAVKLSVVPDGDAAMAFLEQCDPTAPPAEGLPQLLLLDVNLPKESGLDLLEQIRSTPSLQHLVVIILSASTARMDVDRAYALGANGYLSKDLDQDRLERVTKALVTYLEMAGAAGSSEAPQGDGAPPAPKDARPDTR